ncbi:MAG: peptide-methionine (S)-S-oxide reductase MsrA [Candidatus Eisenbacteria bacterium]
MRARLAFSTCSILILFAADAAHASPAPAMKPALRPAAADTALFSGGCFWSMEYGFEGRPGILDVSSGYSGGRTVNPTYDDVNTETTGHRETIQVIYDPRKVSYGELVDLFWHRIDPMQADGQFCDRGDSYRTAIWWRNDRQRTAAEASKKQMEAARALPSPILTTIAKAGPFYRAEEYHQDFYKKNWAHYHAYSLACGRDAKLDRIWGARATHAVAKN